MDLLSELPIASPEDDSGRLTLPTLFSLNLEEQKIEGEYDEG